MRINGIGTLGAYPDDPYYDPNRPSWLPFWIDTPTESELKYNARNILEATANAGSQAVGVVTSGASNVAGAIGGSAAAGFGTGFLSNINLNGLLFLAGAVFLVKTLKS